MNRYSLTLFDLEPDPEKNLLPHDGIVNYYGIVLNRHQSDTYFKALLTGIEWRHDEAVLFGKRIVTKRKVAWYGEKPYDYTYSNTTKSALPWTRELLELKKVVEQCSGETFNSCLLNLYHSGEEGMAFHSDGEPDLKRHGAIGSLSLGARRKFVFKHKITGEKVELMLEGGSLLVMRSTTQEHWLHRLPPTKLVRDPRVNLTFRTIEE